MTTSIAVATVQKIPNEGPLRVLTIISVTVRTGTDMTTSTANGIGVVTIAPVWQTQRSRRRQIQLKLKGRYITRISKGSQINSRRSLWAGQPREVDQKDPAVLSVTFAIVIHVDAGWCR